MQNHALFKELIAGRQGNLTAVCNGLAKFVIVDIALSRDQDNLQLNFESMNSTGREPSRSRMRRTPSRMISACERSSLIAIILSASASGSER